MKQTLTLLTGLLLAPLAVLHAADAPKPNIIVILTDDMGYADIGAHGCKDIPTPHIDRIASRGVRFTDAYANGSFCTPTRAALMSCRYQHRYGMEDLGGPLPAQANTLPQRLKAPREHHLVMRTALMIWFCHRSRKAADCRNPICGFPESAKKTSAPILFHSFLR